MKPRCLTTEEYFNIETVLSCSNVYCKFCLQGGSYFYICEWNLSV